MEISLFDIILGMLIVTAFWIIISFAWRKIRDFYHDNYSYFDLTFIVTYFLEQLLLIILLKLRPEFTDFWVSIFALIVISTASIEKMSMESRDKRLGKLHHESIFENKKVTELNHQITRENEKLSNIISEQTKIIERVLDLKE